MNMINPTALLYARVSSERQKTEGHGLESQEHRCREYAKSKGYEVEKVFKDSFTGAGDFMLRPAMQALLAYVDKRPHKNYVVVFDDLSRFARDVVFHLKLRQAFAARGIKLECPNFNFDDSPEGEMVEIMVAAQNQYHRKNNRRQVIQKQKARLEKGYWPFYPPPGYMQVKDPTHGKLLKPIDPQAGLIREAFEGFATDRFPGIVDAMRFLRASGYSKQTISQDGVRRMLRRVVYAGYVERKEWEVARRKGQHEALVSLETFERVQAKLDGKQPVRIRKSDQLDFVLRGFVLCASCKHPMTGSWSTGRNKKFRYYRCNQPTCERHNKSINGELIDTKFVALLRSITPKRGVIRFVKTVILNLWNGKIKDTETYQAQLEKELRANQVQVDALLKRIVKATDERIIRAYEEQVISLRNEGVLLQEKLRTLGTSTVSFETALETVYAFLENPLVIWRNEDINAKRLVMGLVFSEKLAFHPDFGFETAQKSPLVGLFELVSANELKDVEVGGVEPPCNTKTQNISTRGRLL